MLCFTAGPGCQRPQTLASDVPSIRFIPRGLCSEAALQVLITQCQISTRTTHQVDAAATAFGNRSEHLCENY